MADNDNNHDNNDNDNHNNDDINHASYDRPQMRRNDSTPEMKTEMTMTTMKVMTTTTRQ